MNKKSFKVITLVLLVVAIASAFVIINNRRTQITQNKTPQLDTNTQIKAQQAAKIYNLQPTIDRWIASQNGSASVVIYDLQNQTFIGKLNPDTTYFTASIYKLFVAYEGYLAIQNGKYAADDAYLTGYNRAGCLDAMIRSSYSPCAEKMWNELGKEAITNKLKTYGITNTSMTGLYTSAQDVSILLKRLFEKKDLNQANTDKFLDSMKNQEDKYRRGLPAGFSNAIVYNKVGWNEDLEWHDASIAKLGNGNSYIIVILSKNILASNISQLGVRLNSYLE